MIQELYKKHRPTGFKQLVGQPDAVRVLVDFGRRDAVPHTLLLSGPSGCGKTTIARILRRKLRCGDLDYTELNAANERGIDMVRAVEQRLSFAPIDGKCRVWVVDEAHRLTSDAQSGLLKILEDTPGHVYFILATTEPQKLLRTIRTRATEVKVRLLDGREMAGLLADVAGREGATLAEDVSDKIVELAEGSPRKALVLLDQVIGLDGEEQQLAAIKRSEAEVQAIELARALMQKRPWSEVAKILRSVVEEPESLRWMVLGYFVSVLLGGGKNAGEAYRIIRCFEEPYFNTKRAGLAASCWEALNG